MEQKVSKTKIKKNLKRKTNLELAETIKLSSKNPAWIKLSKILSSPKSNYSELNLSKIDSETTEGDTIVIPGKVLSKGKISKKVRICSLSISLPALEKLKQTKSEYATILEEIKKNPKAEGIKILR